MHVTRVAQADPYTAPRHFGVETLRLQGQEASPTAAFWVGLTHFSPDGGAEQSASPQERVYVVLDGEVSVTGGDGTEATLTRWDSVWFGPDEQRSVLNRSGGPASMLVIMTSPGAEPG